MDISSIDSSSSWELPPPPPTCPRSKHHHHHHHHQALVRYQPQVCGVLAVRKNACFLGVTAIVRRETRERADSGACGTYEYPVIKYIIEDLSWHSFKRFGGLDIIEPDLLHLLEVKSRWWTKTDDWFLLLQCAFGKSRTRTLFTFSDPSVPTLSHVVLPAPPSTPRRRRDSRLSDRVEELA